MSTLEVFRGQSDQKHSCLIRHEGVLFFCDEDNNLFECAKWKGDWDSNVTEEVCPFGVWNFRAKRIDPFCPESSSDNEEDKAATPEAVAAAAVAEAVAAETCNIIYCKTCNNIYLTLEFIIVQTTTEQVISAAETQSTQATNEVKKEMTAAMHLYLLSKVVPTPTEKEERQDSEIESAVKVATAKVITLQIDQLQVAKGIAQQVGRNLTRDITALKNQKKPWTS